MGKKKLACIVPFFILYTGIIIECIFIFIIIILGLTSMDRWRSVLPLSSLLLLSSVWLCVKEIFNNLFSEKESTRSPESREIFELQYTTNYSYSEHSTLAIRTA